MQIQKRFRYLLKETIQKPGLHMNKQFRNHFLQGQDKYGLDLAAMIIQMGRDHGIPGYTTFRTLCGLRRPNNFSDLNDIVSSPFEENPCQIKLYHNFMWMLLVDLI